MASEYLALLVASSLIFTFGWVIYRQWRAIGELAAIYMDTKLVFGPWREAMLIPTAWIIMLAGLVGAGHALVQLYQLLA